MIHVEEFLQKHLFLFKFCISVLAMAHVSLFNSQNKHLQYAYELHGKILYSRLIYSVLKSTQILV